LGFRHLAYSMINFRVTFNSSWWLPNMSSIDATIANSIPIQ
jgi:hypothetical protein